MDSHRFYGLYLVFQNLHILLRNRGYIVPDAPTYDAFLEKYEIMHHVARSSLSMVVTHASKDSRQTCAILFLESSEKKAVSVASIREIHQHLTDTALSMALVIHQQPLSSGARRELVMDGRRIEAIQDKCLMFNPSSHFLVPRLRVLNEEEKQQLLQQFHVKDDRLLPRLDTNDATCRYFGIKKGDVISLERTCETASTSVSYRVCARPD